MDGSKTGQESGQVSLHPLTMCPRKTCIATQVQGQELKSSSLKFAGHPFTGLRPFYPQEGGDKMERREGKKEGEKEEEEECDLS
jgi:hypothetical protein